MESNYFPPTEKEAKEAGVTSSERRNAGFPSRLRQLRNKKGESQATLAKELMVKLELKVIADVGMKPGTTFQMQER